MKLNMNINAETLALGAVASGEVLHAFSSFMPSSFTCHNWVLTGKPEEIDAKIVDWRSGYRPALTMGLALAAALSVLAKSPLPVLMGTAAGAVMLHTYESILPEEKRLPADQWLALLTAGPATDGTLALLEA